MEKVLEQKIKTKKKCPKTNIIILNKHIRIKLIYYLYLKETQYYYNFVSL